jgi:pyruvate formate-lyase activating enzyme-like uncharacterized protein
LTGAIPHRLREIYEQVNADRTIACNLDALQPIWQAHVSAVRRQIPGVHVEAEGEILHLGELSPGCQACKEGTWDCVFTTMRCNLDCAFCYSPHAIPRDYTGSAFGTTREEIGQNQAGTHITATSFSGGEPFVEKDRLFDWTGWFTNQYPDRYYWVYTNGLLVDAESLQTLGALGIDEIRFNMAATGYNHPTVMAHLEAAVSCIPNVTVEIPAMPKDAAKLLSCLADWSALGIRFLNLHELMYEPGTNSASMPGARQVIVTADGHCTEINLESRSVTLAVLRHVRDKDLALSVNDCSMQSKIRQLRGRRRSLAPLLKAPYERLVDDQFYECFCAYWGEEDLSFFHPDSLSLMRQRLPHHDFVRLVRTAPLSIRDAGRWIAFEELSQDTARNLWRRQRAFQRQEKVQSIVHPREGQ